MQTELTTQLPQQPQPHASLRCLLTAAVAACTALTSDSLPQTHLRIPLPDVREPERCKFPAYCFPKAFTESFKHL